VDNPHEGGPLVEVVFSKGQLALKTRGFSTHHALVSRGFLSPGTPLKKENKKRKRKA